jgi:hypothetical protein
VLINENPTPTAPSSPTITTKAEDTSYDITINLEEDPELNILNWKLKVQEVASNLATTVTPTGLLTQILDDTEWAAHPANRTQSPNGTVTVARRPQSPHHVPIITGMGSNQIAVAKYTNDRHQIWHQAKIVLKRSIVESMGPTLSATIGPPPHGFTLRSIRQIVDDISAKFANVDAVALEALEDHILTPLDSVYGLEKHISRPTRYILMSANAGFPIEEYRRVRLFRKSVQGHHQIARTLETFDDRHPNPKTHTFTQVTTWVREKLPPILTAAGKPQALRATAIATPIASAADLQSQLVALSAQIEKLQDNRKRNRRGQDDRRGRKKRRERDNTPNDTTPRTAVTAGECEHYCFAHGRQNSHTSTNCRPADGQSEGAFHSRDAECNGAAPPSRGLHRVTRTAAQPKAHCCPGQHDPENRRHCGRGRHDHHSDWHSDDLVVCDKLVVSGAARCHRRRSNQHQPRG